MSHPYSHLLLFISTVGVMQSMVFVLRGQLRVDGKFERFVYFELFLKQLYLYANLQSARTQRN